MSSVSLARYDLFAGDWSSPNSQKALLANELASLADSFARGIPFRYPASGDGTGGLKSPPVSVTGLYRYQGTRHACRP